MVTERRDEFEEVVAALRGDTWGEILDAVGAALAWIRQAEPGDPQADDLILVLVGLASHDKWEIRRAIAQAAAELGQPAFEPMLAQLAADPNARVRQAAQSAALRRRDGRHASVFGKEHADRINATLDGIHARFGPTGRDAVRRAAETIANTFARELYHEVIRLMSPLATAAERLQKQLTAGTAGPDALLFEAKRIGRQVRHLEAVMNAMRSYAAVPVLVFAPESLRDICTQAAHLAQGGTIEGRDRIEIEIDADVVCEVAGTRLVQAFTNLLANAIEAYDGVGDTRQPIEVRAECGAGSVEVTIRDFGVGMSPERLRDAPKYFASGKPGGTGFGLPLAIKIVESEHGGRLRLSSEKGLGTTVRVVLPLRHVELT